MSETRGVTRAPARRGDRITAPDGTVFRDLNGNGTMEPYEDPRLPVQERVEDLLRRLSVPEKAGLMFQSIIGVPASGSLADEDPATARGTAADLVGSRLMNHFNVHLLPEPRLTARWVNELQRLAVEATPHGIPVTLSTDPRHAWAENQGASFRADHFSAWPEALGLAALRDEDVVREFARTAREEYLAVGLRAALHPTVDLATEPRWARQYGTFGQDPDLAGRLAVAYLDGFEGERLGPGSVACTAKHFPGGGPQKDGEDAHFPYGREQVYPGGMFERHLEPFRRVLERGVSAIMPYYGMPVGLTLHGRPVEEVGFGFNRQVVTGLLREELGFDGVVCTDWGLVTESRTGGRTLPARAWGVEHLDVAERVLKILDAGCDQLGGEQCPEVVVALVERGLVSESRLDVSVRRLLRVKFELGLFDDPFVDEDAAGARVGTPGAVAAGRRAQAESVTVLHREPGVLPLAPGTPVHAEGLEAGALEAAGLRSATAEQAEVAVVRLQAPWEPRDTYMLEAQFHAGSLEFDDGTVRRVADLAAELPVVVTVNLDRPAVLTPLLPHSAALVGVYGTSDAALLDVLAGRVRARGRLPFQLPRSDAAAAASRPDVPGDSPEALFEAGDGLVDEG
ncbi:glycoside hydrolase family 3 protein [Kineococcus sp. SYSU DK018]|uniref:glycoside hydrolase family 3 protein n=1 Tax=Kineococcus sp. SYSU DK018 TaxID=3383139 RepID=UPI003D7DD9C0